MRVKVKGRGKPIGELTLDGNVFELRIDDDANDELWYEAKFHVSQILGLLLIQAADVELDPNSTIRIKLTEDGFMEVKYDSSGK